MLRLWWIGNRQRKWMEEELVKKLVTEQVSVLDRAVRRRPISEGSARDVAVVVRLPLPLKRAAVREVERRGTNMNDVLVGAIARRYGIGFHPTNRIGRPSIEKGTVLLRMSDRLKYAIQRDALDRRSNIQDTLVRILADAFAVEIDLTRSFRTTPFGGGRRQAA